MARKPSKQKLIKAINQAIAEIAEAFGISVDDVIDVMLEAYGDGGATPKAKKAETAPKAKKSGGKKKTATAAGDDLAKGDKVVVKVDGKRRTGVVVRVAKTKVRVKLGDGSEVAVPKTDVKKKTN